MIMLTWHDVILGGLGEALVALLMALAWTLSLRRQIHWYTKDLHAEIARRVATEAVLQQTIVDLANTKQQLAQSKKDLERFAEIAAHHLMEPARRLVTFAQRLQLKLGNDANDTDVAIMLDFITSQAIRLRALLRDVQLYLAAEQFPTAQEPSDAEAAAKTAIQRLQQQIRAAEAQVIVSVLPPTTMPMLQLVNLFSILLDNAVRYRYPTRPCTIHITGQTTAGVGALGYPPQTNEVVQYRVIDNGLGIPMEYRERVFQVFERLHVPTDQDSTGIGLSIARRMVMSRNGKIWIEETAGGGATIVIELPEVVMPT